MTANGGGPDATRCGACGHLRRDHVAGVVLRACPRCKGFVKESRDQYGTYHECLQCGYMDSNPGREAYDQAPRTPLRYVGDFADMRDKIMQVRALRSLGAGDPKCLAYCPFCDQEMEETSSHPNRRVHTCPAGHMASVVYKGNALAGWQ